MRWLLVISVSLATSWIVVSLPVAPSPNSLSAAESGEAKPAPSEAKPAPSEAKPAQPSRRHLVFMIGEAEYETAGTLPEFFAAELADRGFRATWIRAPNEAPSRNDFAGLEDALADADLLVLSVRRRAPTVRQMEAIRAHLVAGKPLVAIRTASHAFDTRGQVTAGHAEWLKFDEQVLGGRYQGHFGDESVAVTRNAAAAESPLLRGVTPWTSSKLYQSSLVSDRATLLLSGQRETGDAEPVAWTNLYGDRATRVFYTSLGIPSDFQAAGFRRLLRNAIYWALDQDAPGDAISRNDDSVSHEVAPRATDYGQSTSAVAEDVYPLQPSDVEPTLEVVEDLQLDLLLREPIVANPLQLSFDERGRLWVVQYRQYPWPAGLKLLSRDNVWRNVYDPPFPPPPPHAADSPFRGQDRITIHTDRDQDGTFDEHKVFLDGLNFATAALPGRGGVFVLNPPYLLFYADQDRDDRPDDLVPQVLLSGFGIEDSHSIANSLRWGPDGWIYATQGSTVSGSVVVHGPNGLAEADQTPVHSLGQNVWRYHPETHRYEVFAEGGGNSFGVEIDSQGRVYSGHNGGDTRGFYYVQGGYSQKNFGKHGQLSNPYAFAYYGAMRHHPVVRFTHTFCIYEADSLPARYHGRLFGVNPVEHHVVLSEIGPDGASRQTRDIAIVVAAGRGDRADWFTPVDIQLGPDGSLYLADWYSVQPNHYRNHEGQTNPDLGRVYRLRGKQFEPSQAFDLAKLTSAELIDRYLFHSNRWFRQQALRLLGDRRDANVIAQLETLVQERTGPDALHALWALHLSGGLDATRAMPCLQHADPHVRRWTIRILGDDRLVAPELATRLRRLAHDEPDVETRCQLAATAKRLPADQAIPILFELLARPEDVADPYVPNMLWWALEAHADRPDLILSYLQRTDPWQAEYRVGGYRIPQNLMRRYAMSGRQNDLQVCATLMQLAPTSAERDRLLEAFVKSFEGRELPPLPLELARELARSSGPFALLLGVRQQDEEAVAQALQLSADSQAPSAQRLELIRALGEVRAAADRTPPMLAKLLTGDEAESIRNAALIALQKFSDDEIGTLVLNAYPNLSEGSQAVARQLLASRAGWAEAMLGAVEQGTIPATSLESEIQTRLRRHPRPTVVAAMERLFPEQATDVAALEARIDAMEQIVRQGDGNPLSGRDLFQGKANCAKCHRLFAQGNQIGPDLTSYNRTNLRRMLLAIVHPSAEIREGFENFTVVTDDGRVLAGLKMEHNDQLLVLRGTDGQDQSIPLSQIDELLPDPRSLMPEHLLAELSEDEIRDLFAYLTSTTPPL